MVLIRRLWGVDGLMSQKTAENLIVRKSSQNLTADQLKRLNFYPGAFHVYTRLCDMNYHAICEYDLDLKQNYEILMNKVQYGTYFKFVLQSNILIGCIILWESKDQIIVKRFIEKSPSISDHLRLNY